MPSPLDDEDDEDEEFYRTPSVMFAELTALIKEGFARIERRLDEIEKAATKTK